MNYNTFNPIGCLFINSMSDLCCIVCLNKQETDYWGYNIYCNSWFHVDKDYTKQYFEIGFWEHLA